MQVLVRAVREAKEQECDIILCDTSGRLHTNWQLMEELAKVERDIGRKTPGAPHEVLLVLDGSTGLNMLNQVRALVLKVNRGALLQQSRELHEVLLVLAGSTGLNILNWVRSLVLPVSGPQSVHCKR